jgi:hypothetical protein
MNRWLARAAEVRSAGRNGQMGQNAAANPVLSNLSNLSKDGAGLRRGTPKLAASAGLAVSPRQPPPSLHRPAGDGSSRSSTGESTKPRNWSDA